VFELGVEARLVAFELAARLRLQRFELFLFLRPHPSHLFPGRRIGFFPRFARGPVEEGVGLVGGGFAAEAVGAARTRRDVASAPRTSSDQILRMAMRPSRSVDVVM
jgi:hypothetical protein